jgi:GntR family transcriptional regulator
MREALARMLRTSLDDPHAAAPLYLRLKTAIVQAIESGFIKPGDALPSERDIADDGGISRVTVRKAVQDLVRSGLLVQRHGSGTFVAAPGARVQQSLSRLTSFSEDMARRGMSLRSEWLEKGVFQPSPDEMMVLGLSADEMVARISRIRIANEVPLAIERAAISASILPDPDVVTRSLYEVLDKTGNKPVRAVQRISAMNLTGPDAQLLGVREGAASLRIERISYLSSGKVVEYTRSIYRGGAYDFVAELRIGGEELSA